MQISSTFRRPITHRPTKTEAQAAEQTVRKETRHDSTQESSFVRSAKTAAGLMVPVIGLASTGAAAYYASDFLHLGNSIPALYGVLAGAGVGGAAGLGMGLVGAKAYETFSSDDQAGKGMIGGLMAFGAGAAGAVIGGVGGAFGANPLVTVPAGIAGGITSLIVLTGVASAGAKLFGE